MKNLYGSISISKEMEQGNKEIYEKINYYKIKEEKYGFEIEKKYDNDKIEKIHKIDVTDNENEINCILDALVYKGVMPCSDDIVEDLVKKYT